MTSKDSILLLSSSSSDESGIGNSTIPFSYLFRSIINDSVSAGDTTLANFPLLSKAAPDAVMTRDGPVSLTYGKISTSVSLINCKARSTNGIFEVLPVYLEPAFSNSCSCCPIVLSINGLILNRSPAFPPAIITETVGLGSLSREKKSSTSRMSSFLASSSPMRITRI
ncbi:hypothetical protein D3C81_1680890 [compost metagenome]